MRKGEFGSCLSLPQRSGATSDRLLSLSQHQSSRSEQLLGKRDGRLFGAETLLLAVVRAHHSWALHLAGKYRPQGSYKIIRKIIMNCLETIRIAMNAC